MRRVVPLLLALVGCGDNLAARPDARPASDAVPTCDPGDELLTVVGASPAAHATAAPAGGDIVIDFDRPVSPDTVTAGSLWAFGRWSGTADATLEVSADGRSATLSPQEPFFAGEQVRVYVSNALRGVDGAPMRRGGYSFQFRVAAAQAQMSFSEYARMSTRGDPDEYGQVYGGVASDMNDDGWPDITAINENSDDIVVFLNRGDQSGMVDRMESPYSVGTKPSPSEPADFDRDGHTDVVVANIASSDLSLLMGRGDGTFDVVPSVAVGSGPRGVAVLDADGDGDLDVVSANRGASTLSLLLNDGTGAFEAAAPIETDGDGDWAIAAADMNGDGLLDLVVGSNLDGRVTVLLNDCDGGFVYKSSVDASVDLWQLNVGDLDGDGDADVAVAGGGPDESEVENDGEGVVLMNDGTGVLGGRLAYATDPRTLATDLGDLDGDGDLDWVLSSVGGANSDWTVLENDGAGSYSIVGELDSPEDASCALLVDLDGDRDLDLGLIDEAEDLLLLFENE